MQRALGGLIAVLLLVLPAAAAQDNRYIDAIDAIDEAVNALWEKAPLSFRKALWVAEPPDGFGAYKPRENNVYASGDEMIAYVEPVGFGWKKSGEIYQTDLAADVMIKSKDGKEIYSQKDFQKLALSSRVRNREFMTRFTFTLTGIPAGEYVLDTALRDAVSGKSGSFSLPFVIK